MDIPGQRTLTGALTGKGHALELTVSQPFLFAGRSDAGAIRGLADGLARQGLTLTVTSPAGPLVTLGARRTPWWQRALTGSRHIRLERGAGLWSLLRGRSRAPSGGALPTAELAPPATVWPIAPTFRRRWRMPVTTTHAAPGAGNPRLILAPSLAPAARRSPAGLPAPRRYHHHRVGPELRHRAARSRTGPRRGAARRGGRVRPGRPQRHRIGARQRCRRRPLAPAHGVPRASRRADHVVLPRGVRRPRASVRRPAGRRDRPPATAAPTHSPGQSGTRGETP